MSENILLNKRILVAEDNTINQMIVKHSLLKLGCSLDIASDGIEAIERLKEREYDVILMDIQMPCLDGYETTMFIRNQLQSNIPVIAMTAFALNGEEEKCYEKGMNGYVSKPFNMESLSNALKKALSMQPAKNSNPYIFSSRQIAVDVSLLYDISGNDESYILLMVKTFLEQMPLNIEKMEQGMHQQDWNLVYQSAHTAKSSLSIIKISEVFDWVVTIESNAKNKINLETIPSLIIKVKEKFQQAEQLLAQKFSAAVNS